MKKIQPVNLTIPADSKYLSLMRTVLKHLLSYYEVHEDLVRKLVLCVDEACANVIKHSYEFKCSEPIEIISSYKLGVKEGEVVRTQDEVIVVIYLLKELKIAL